MQILRISFLSRSNYFVHCGPNILETELPKNNRKIEKFQSKKISNDQELIVTKWIKSCLLQCFGTFKMPILMFISILVFRPEGQIWYPVRRDTRIYVRRILNASRISETQLNSCTISPS